MKKTILLFIALLLSFQWVAAQTVSDEQVIKIVLAEKEKGSDEKTIAQKLLRQGVTPAQLRRIKAKYEQEQNGVGAVDVTGVDRSRNKNIVAGKEGRGGEFMLRDERKLDNKQKLEMVQEGMGFLDIDSVAYYSNLLNKDEVYGRNLFNNELLTFEPAMNIPTPVDYVLGPGDQVIIDIWGASQQNIEGVISPDGYIVVEGVGPVNFSGLTVAEAIEHARNMLGEYYSGSSITLSLGTTRSVKVEIVGDVVAPGSYTLSAFSTLFNALYMAGGISDMGTLRDIKVFRNGKQVSKIDVYDYIINGNNKGNIRLQDNDLVAVGPYDAIVNIQGKVKRPMKYEMKGDETLSKLISYTGGFTGDAFTKNVRVVRKSGREYSIHTVTKDALSTFKLLDGDSVYVDSIMPRFSNMVEIKGAVMHPGLYELGTEINTVYDLINAADGLLEDAFTARAVMHRRKADRRLEVLAVDIEGILEGTVPDVELRKEDILFIPSMSDMRGEQTFKILGEVRFPGIYEFAENTALEDLVLQAGGLTDAASMAKVDVYRKIYDPLAMHEQDTLTETFSFALKDGFVIDGTPGFVLAPYDEVHVRKSPVHADIKSVTIDGAVNFAGDYAMRSNNYRLSDLVNEAGGLSDIAYPQGARLYRKMTEEERANRENIMKLTQIQIYEESLRSESEYNISLADSLMNLKLELGDVYPVAISLEAAMENPSGSENISLREGDYLVIPQYTSTVKISGEVRYPITINYKKGEKLSYYIKHAGGYTDRAKKGDVYAIYMNGGVSEVSKYSSKDIKPGCEIVVPTKSNTRKLSTAEILTIGTSTASIATMIVTLVNLLK
ncbi:MAG: SLBB domain-containing protein [Bacteroidaceae bacterium]|nr:SLBB domain-containing protein [Bacteroidaceae bacterium]